jgi:hypothetical protein
MPLSSRPDIAEALRRASAFSGWSFDEMNTRVLGEPVPWDYDARARELAASARVTVDLGTGGGEVFGRVISGLPGRFLASEEWDVNAAVAASALPVPVLRARSECTPFRSGIFGLVLSRHEAIDPPEIDRILARGGTFLTQQVCPEHWPELKRYFPRATTFPDHWTSYRGWFADNGYQVRARRHDYRVDYGPLANLVYLLAVMPWEVPDFDIDADEAALLALERDAGGAGIVLSEGRYLLEARKPG